MPPSQVTTDVGKAGTRTGNTTISNRGLGRRLGARSPTPPPNPNGTTGIPRYPIAARDTYLPANRNNSSFFPPPTGNRVLLQQGRSRGIPANSHLGFAAFGARRAASGAGPRPRSA